MSEFSDTYDDYDLDDGGRSGSGVGKVLLIGCGSIVAVVLLLLMGIGWMMTTGFLPDSKVIEGDALSDRMRAQLEEAQILTPEDQVLLFYSFGTFSAAEGGSAITGTGLVDWIELEETLEVNRVPYAAIQSVRIDERGDFFTDSMLEVETENLIYYPLISVEEDGDERFRDRLILEWEERGGHRPEDVPPEFHEGELEFLHEIGEGPSEDEELPEGETIEPGDAPPDDD